jgi:perosamine synthetase
MKLKRYEFSLQYPKPLKKSELKPLLEVARSGLFSRYTGSFVKDLEVDLAKYYGKKHAVTCTSGTAALHGCLTALNFPVGSEIITTPVADIGVVLPIIYENLVPVFADIDPETYNLDSVSVESKITSKTKAIIAVHLAGSPADLTSFQKLCRKHNLVLLEDFSQAHGAIWHGKKVGSIGLMSYGSFQQSKQITCGEGGVIVTDDNNLAYRALIGVDKGWQRAKPLEERFYEFLALNLRFNAVQAAILKPQLKRLDALIGKKRKLASLVHKVMKPVSAHIKMQKILDNCASSYYSFPMYVTGDEKMRDKLLKLLNDKYNIRAAYGYANPVPLYQCVMALMNPAKYGKGFKYSNRKYPKSLCPNAEALLKKSFLIPFNENYSEKEMTDIADRVVTAVREITS